MKSTMGFKLGYLNLILAYYEGQLGSWNGVSQIFPPCFLRLYADDHHKVVAKKKLYF